MEPPSLSRFASHPGKDIRKPATPLRIGILGAARIAPMAVIGPARSIDGVSVDAVAARDPERARAFASKHGIPRTPGSYEALIDDPNLDAIYNPLPNGLHCEWTLRALDAGKHVLCEKPMASNADEALQMAEAARAADRVLMEAFHWRYHPLAQRMREVVKSGALGRVRHIETRMCIPFLLPGDIRYRYDLAGGATMDVGTYAINMLRFLADAEPEVVRAQSKLASPEVDRWMRADFRFADGRTGRMTCSLLSASLVSIGARVKGDQGEMRVFNPVAPHIYHRLKVRNEAGTTIERVRGESTYTCQLRAFVAGVTEGRPIPSDGTDGVANMSVIDAVYRAAGMRRRGV